MYLQLFNHFQLFILLSLTLFATVSVTEHIDTPCQHLEAKNFTPCFNLFTGSSANGSSSTDECCAQLNNLSHSDIDCACLLVIGTIPAQLTFLRSLAAALPRSCNVSSVPLQCKGYGAPLPAPGPAVGDPSRPPAATTATSPKASGATTQGPAPVSGLTEPSPVTEETPRSTGPESPHVLSSASDTFLSSKPASIMQFWLLITAIVTGFI